jgi:hypothetical protein
MTAIQTVGIKGYDGFARLTRVQHDRIDSIAATCRQMSGQEAAEIADFIFSLFLRIAENLDRDQRLWISQKR